jgi:hypothetical protein
VTSSHTVYRDVMQSEWPGWWITWPLSKSIHLGDVFDTADDVLRSAGTLHDRGIPFSASRGAPPGFFKYDSKGSAQVRFKAAGSTGEGFSALGTADAGALVEFKGDAAILVIFRNLGSQEMSDTRSVASQLVRQWWQGTWPEGLVVVTEVVSVGAGTVLAATGRGASIELRANVSGSTAPSLLDLAGEVSIARSQQLALEWIGTELTPFFHVGSLRRSWLGSIRADYGPRQRGARALPATPVPATLLDQVRDSPETVLQSTSELPQPPFEAQQV